MAEGVRDETGERSGAGGPADGRESPSSGGDLEFDEAWGEPHGVDETGGDRSATAEAPRFEDPSDR